MTMKTLPSLVCQLVLSASVATLAPTEARAQTKLANPLDKFRQLEEILPTPNDQRTASGAPGSRYWQQKADYVIDVELDEVNRRIIGRETITYKNNSPDTLTYLWLQLDQNAFRPDSDMNVTRTAPPVRVTPPMPGATPAPGGRPRSRRAGGVLLLSEYTWLCSYTRRDDLQQESSSDSLARDFARR